MHVLEEIVRICTPTESFWVAVLLVGAVMILFAYVLSTIAVVKHGSGVMRGFLAALVLLTVVAAGLAFYLVYEHQPFAGLAILAFLGMGLLLGLVTFVFAFGLWSKAKRPILLLIVGLLTCATPFAYTHLVEPIVFRMFRPPWIARVDGELHVTITGVAGFDYDRLKDYSNAVVLQMANPDVTDKTLEKLRDFKLLRELDLNDTQITDAGLAELKNFASLEKIRLKNTKITDAGFREHLMERAWITDLDVRGTEVASKTMRRWKSEKDGRNYLK
jgi:hypothetical protein